MEIKTIIEVKAFGDFDILYTDCIMISLNEYDFKELLKEFYLIMGVDSNTGLDRTILNRITEDFKAFLKLKGFSKLKTQSIYFCD